MEYMENIIKKQLESNIQMYYPAEDEDKKERSKHRVRKSIS
jgi:hypothetical protein